MIVQVMELVIQQITYASALMDGPMMIVHNLLVPIIVITLDVVSMECVTVEMDTLENHVNSYHVLTHALNMVSALKEHVIVSLVTQEQTVL